MIDRELLKQLAREEQLTAEEAWRLDSALESDESAQIARAVKAMEGAEPSLEWRSALNQKLASTVKTRRTTFWVMGLSASTAAAAVVAVGPVGRWPSRIRGSRLAHHVRRSPCSRSSRSRRRASARWVRVCTVERGTPRRAA